MRLALFLLALPAFSQTINIAAGMPTDPGIGGYPWTSSAISSQPAPFSVMRASATTIAYDVPVANGSCVVTLRFIEPRPAGSDPASQSFVGSRLFTISVNGSAPVTLDIFSVAGALTPYTLPLPAITVTDGHIRLQFVAVRGNAIVSGILIVCTPPPSATFVDATTPTGTQDGVNAVFTLPSAPNPPSSLDLYRNGLYQTQGADYTLAGSTITFLVVPRPGDRLTAKWRQ